MSKLISIIIPVYNDELIKVWEDLKKKYDYEIIFVDDGSTDKSLEVLRNICKKDQRVKTINFSRNFGHQKAIQAGLEFIKGDCGIMMDCDLQHPPQIIPQMIEKWEKGYDIVNTTRQDSKELGLFKKITSMWFYWLINKISDISIERGSADFRLIDKKVVEVLRGVNSKEIFYRGLVNWVGFKNTSINYYARKRRFGKSSYTFRKMMELAKIGIISFSMWPIKIILVIGILIILCSFLLLLVMLCYCYFIDVKYFSPLAFVVVFIVLNSGIMLFSQGIVAIYIMSMLKEVQRRPNYIIREKINLNNHGLHKLSKE